MSSCQGAWFREVSYQLWFRQYAPHLRSVLVQAEADTRRLRWHSVVYQPVMGGVTGAVPGAIRKVSANVLSAVLVPTRTVLVPTRRILVPSRTVLVPSRTVLVPCRMIRSPAVARVPPCIVGFPSSRALKALLSSLPPRASPTAFLGSTDLLSDASYPPLAL